LFHERLLAHLLLLVLLLDLVDALLELGLEFLLLFFDQLFAEILY
jgi:hypothetical protein